MSKANGTVENKNAYLQHVSLRNNFIIKDVEINFKAGINVIIGKNATGKTSFFNYLYSFVHINWEPIVNYLEGEFTFIRDDKTYRLVVDGLLNPSIAKIDNRITTLKKV